MNVFLYVALVTSGGVVTALILGHVMSGLSRVSAVLVFVSVSIVLGAFLSFAVLNGVNYFCVEHGIRSADCIRTNEGSVWYLALPLVAFPLYIVSMFVARARARTNSHHDVPAA